MWITKHPFLEAEPTSKGRDHSPPKACFKDRAQVLVGIHSDMSIQITKEIGVGSLGGVININ